MSSAIRRSWRSHEQAKNASEENHRLHDGHPPDCRRRDRARLQEARSHRGGRERHPQLRWHQRRRRRIPRDPAAQDHGADRPERGRQDHPVQPAHGLRYAEHGQVAVRGQAALPASPRTRWPAWAWCAPSSSPRSWASSPSWRTCAWARPTSPANASRRPCSRACGAAGKRRSPPRQMSCWRNSSWTPRRTTTRLPSPAASASSWKWPVPSWSGPNSSCWMSRWPGSTPR